MTKKKTSKKTEYDSVHVQTLKNLKVKFGWSVRKISKETGIPKSTVGRWVKDSRSWERNYDFRDTKRKVKSRMSRKDFDEFKKMERKILKAPIGRQSELTVHFIDDDEDYVLES